VDLEGALRIRLAVADGRVERVRVASTRPDIARLLLQGRRRSDIQAALPRLFSVCGHSQAAAGDLACAAAAGELATEGTLARCRAEVSAEIVREVAWRVLLDWPQRIGEQPSAGAVVAARAAEASRVRAALPSTQDAHAIALAVFGAGADEWLSMRSTRELDRWLDAGRTHVARFMRRTRDDEAANDFDAAGRDATVPLLHDADPGAAMLELWSVFQVDADFCRRPTWRGQPAETGALARLQSDPLIAELTRRSASRVVARLMARLRELASMLAGRGSAAVGVQALPSGGAAAWVENARGLLVHEVRFEDDCAASYRIIAPTEWNFHPAGALAAALAGSAASDRAALEQRAIRIAQSLDPCVACRVEIDDA